MFFQYIIDYVSGIISSISKIAILNGDYATLQDNEDFYNSIMVIVCTLCAALASGLTIGLMAFDSTKLEIKAMIGDAKEISAAQSILPLIKQHHLLLVTLMLFNAAATEAMPIFLGALVPNYIAILISVTLVLIFGEIIPASIFTGPQQLTVAGRCTGLVRFLISLFYPIAFPISKVLDYLFGAEEESSNIARDELEALILLQNTTASSQSRVGEVNCSPGRSAKNLQSLKPAVKGAKNLSEREVELLIGVLKLSNSMIQDVMIAIENMYSISADTILDSNSRLGSNWFTYSQILDGYLFSAGNNPQSASKLTSFRTQSGA
eukprot:gene1028-2016_t